MVSTQADMASAHETAPAVYENRGPVNYSGKILEKKVLQKFCSVQNFAKLLQNFYKPKSEFSKLERNL
jgi:hypothetical protein